MYGGFVRWNVGVCDDGSDSIAVQVAPATHWPEMEILVLVVSNTYAVSSVAIKCTAINFNVGICGH